MTWRHHRAGETGRPGQALQTCMEALMRLALGTAVLAAMSDKVPCPLGQTKCEGREKREGNVPKKTSSGPRGMKIRDG